MFCFRQYLETIELMGDEKYAYIVRPFDVCGLLSNYIDWYKDYQQYDDWVTNVPSPLTTIDLKSIEEGDVIVFDSFEKFDEYRENKDKLNKTNNNNEFMFIKKLMMTTAQRRRGLFLQ